MGSAEENAFLTHLAVEIHVSASTENKAWAALLVLGRVLLEWGPDLVDVMRATQKRR
jgi:hypothetical protein